MIEKPLRDNLLLLAQSFAEAKGLELESVSFRIYGLKFFLGDFRKGKRTCSLRLYDKMLKKLSDEWPEDVPWPLLKTVSIERVGKRVRKTNRV